jgi:hypothetical protein
MKFAILIAAFIGCSLVSANSNGPKVTDKVCFKSEEIEIKVELENFLKVD